MKKYVSQAEAALAGTPPSLSQLPDFTPPVEENGLIRS